MANREALRQLQARLAQQLQQARLEPRSASWLAVDCAGLGLLVSLPSAGEIFALAPVLPVPHTAPWFLGVANLRGQLHSVVDLGAFLGLRQQQAPVAAMMAAAAQAAPAGSAAAANSAVAAADLKREPARLLALNTSLGSNCALLVDRLAGLRNAEQLQPEPAPAAGGKPEPQRPAFAGPRWRDADGRAWQEIELGALARHEQFLGIAA
jgi:twitching motility protein PilI